MSGKSKKSEKVDAESEEETILEEEVADIEAELQTTDASKKSGKGKKTKNEEPGKEGKTEKKPRSDAKAVKADPILAVCVAVLLIASVCVIASTVNDKFISSATGSPAEYGSEVIVNYTGSFYCYYDEDGAVIFDTTLSNVGNSSEYVKSWEYSKTSYSPINFTIGKGTYLAMFEDALIGHVPGDVVEVAIPAADAYGLLTDTQTKTISTADGSVAVSCTMTLEDFKEFFGVSSVTSSMVSPYGWNANVYSNTNGTVTFNYAPVVGETYEMNDVVSVKVTDITSSGTIEFEYVFDQDKIIQVEGSEIEMVQIVVDNTYVYVTNMSGDEITYKTTEEKVGETLYFTITFVGYAKSD
ncbi:MAG: FKBP-type peptidyl-prolyl cis-trans isomerase [Candidatus Methanomethylophilaceae archaeon]